MLVIYWENVTDDHYTSFSSEEAGARLHDYMSVLAPVEVIDYNDISSIVFDGEKQTQKYTPDTTRQRVVHWGNYRLKPREEIIIHCPHGVTGSAIMRRYNKDGSIRIKEKLRKRDVYAVFSWWR